MSTGPQMQDGEVIVYHHTPDMGAFKRTALVLLAITLVPTAMMMAVLPDTLWVAVPLFVTCFLLMQERFTLGKYAAWLTDRRIILQSGEAHDLKDVTAVDIIANAVRLRHDGRPIKLSYPKDKPALKDTIDATLKAAREQEAP